MTRRGRPALRRWLGGVLASVLMVAAVSGLVALAVFLVTAVVVGGLALQLRLAQAEVPAELGDLSAELEQITAGLASALDELREYARGIHPAVLTQHGLEPAVTMMTRGSPVPVELDLRLAGRLPEQVEVGAYYVVSEALANVAKHAAASGVAVGLTVSHGLLRVTVRDNGRGGADLSRGTGLVGLKDRVEALRGRLYLDSPAGGGTILRAEFPGC